MTELAELLLVAAHIAPNFGQCRRSAFWLIQSTKRRLGLSRQG